VASPGSCPVVDWGPPGAFPAVRANPGPPPLPIALEARLQLLRYNLPRISAKILFYLDSILPFAYAWNSAGAASAGTPTVRKSPRRAPTLVGSFDPMRRKHDAWIDGVGAAGAGDQPCRGKGEAGLQAHRVSAEVLLEIQGPQTKIGARRCGRSGRLSQLNISHDRAYDPPFALGPKSPIHSFSPRPWTAPGDNGSGPSAWQGTGLPPVAAPCLVPPTNSKP
jgi:hypothetical protein